MKRSHWSKRSCSKVFCKISTNRIGSRVGFQLGIFKPTFPPKKRKRVVKKKAHMNHGLATTKKEIRMPFCFPHISVKKEIKLALNHFFSGLCTTPGGSNYFIFLIGWLIWRHATLFLTKETDCTCGLWISCPQCADSRVHPAGSEPCCILMRGLARRADSVSSCFLLCWVFFFTSRIKKRKWKGRGNK